MIRQLLISLLTPPLVLLAACDPGREPRERVLLVTTTTVEGSGLLDELVDAYHASQDRYRLATTAVGSGAALAIGRRGDADVLLTHDPAGEAKFMEAGHGVEQGAVMRNEFIVVGPPADPAGIRGETELSAALARIVEAGSTFVSRADDSGTHAKELELRGRAEREGRPGGRAPPGSYLETGSGMAETLRVADQRGAYALTDSGTFRHLSGRLRLEALARGDPPEVNVYRYTLPRRPRRPDGARSFITWLRGRGQTVIAGYGRDRFGEPLFHAAATPAAPPAATAADPATVP